MRTAVPLAAVGACACLLATKPLSAEVVVARYAEDLGWLREPPFDAFTRVTVYDKSGTGDPRAGRPPRHAQVRPLPNVGRCDHTYLHHIIQNYDTLADVTLFVPGSCRGDPAKWQKASWVARHVQATGGSAFPDVALPAPVDEALADFSLDQWQSSDPENARANPASKLLPCPERPFGAWYRANSLSPVTGITFQGIFAVSREAVRQRPRDFYQGLIRYVDHHPDPEAGHYLERAWLAVFHPVPPSGRLSCYT